MDAQWINEGEAAAMGSRMIRLAKAAAALHMAEASRLRAHRLRPGDVGFEWSGALTLDEFEAAFDVRTAAGDSPARPRAGGRSRRVGR